MTNFEQVCQYNFPTVIRFGKGAILELGPHLKEQGVTRPLVVTDPGIVGLDFFVEIINELKERGLTPSVFHEISKNPVKSDVHSGQKAYVTGKCDSIVGVGGGAGMDVARSIAVLVNHDGDLFKYEDGVGDHLVTNEIPYMVMVPTTAGTGSEVGRSAVIADDQTHQKKIIFHPNLLAKRVFADPMLSMGLPRDITAATGMDALVHNIEAYLAKGFHPMCDGIALEGIRLAGESIAVAVNAPDLVSRSKMLIASLMGAVAFQKGLGVIHSVAHSLSAHFDLHHGLANAVMLPYGLKFNAEVCEDRIETIGSVLGIKDANVEKVAKYFFDLNNDLGIPTNLSAFNIGDGDVDKLAETALADPCHPSNPREVGLEDFKEIFINSL
jgi:alcohol dehydrogenase class IV